ncbi:MAG: response regulator transcription factor [Romboutsia sp.]|uniref:response regulator transcription factor n=1 Tax=Romboutsia sp. TaxID=1965302 RepID=UPI003F3AB4D3
MKILLVEDEIKLSNILKKGIKKQGLAVDTALDGEEALYKIELNSYDLVILDLNIPKIKGLDVLRTIRKTSNTKVLILSANSSVEDKVLGLDLGANDYMQKPFDFIELLARIRNLLRWKFNTENEIIKYRDISINIVEKTVTKLGESIHLTNKEYGILEYLVMNRNRYIKSEEIIEHVWDSEVDLFSNSFKFHISTLKKKLQMDGLITNIRGKGYKFGEDEES